IDKALKFERELVKLVESVRPASVTIENWQARGNAPPIQVGAGSGVIISAQGHVITNQHVVQGAKEIWVVLTENRRLKAELVGNDPRGDVALLRIENKKIRYKDPRKANAAKLSAGQWVIATGNPFFLAGDGEPVVTLGVVSGLGRVLPGDFFYGDAIQHDARINPGNSGGPLWDMNGNLLGLNGKIASSGAGGFGGPSSSGAGFTIAINQIRNFLESMLEGRASRHGDQLLGLKVETFRDKDGTAAGAEVKEVDPASPARLAKPSGIQVGDVITSVTIAGKQNPIQTATDYTTLLSPLSEGMKVTFVVRRGTRKIVIPGIVLEPSRKGGK
ncbi:MAG: trypsin-like peptidase domain-containing protein, partial [Planctomycetes bacterium]|nr:trypsin-like peptidase domain-containing protein [Planctomycetota bacterium]